MHIQQDINQEECLGAPRLLHHIYTHTYKYDIYIYIYICTYIHIHI